MPPSEQLEEIGALATLIDENRFSYSLDSLCAWRGLPGKDTTLLQEAIKAAGWTQQEEPDQSLHLQMPAHYVGPYAEADPIATLALFENSTRSSTAKARATPIASKSICCRWCMEMRRRGIRIDQSAAEQARDYCLQKRDAALAELSEQLGSHVEHGTRSHRQNGRREPSTPTASAIRARRKAIRHSRPAKSVGWPRIRTGCRA